MIFKTPYNSVPDVGEVNLEPSKTIPDQSMTISEIMRRFASGLPITGAKVPIYEEDDLLGGLDIRTLDLSEREDLKRSLADELQSIKTKLETQQAAKLEKQQFERFKQIEKLRKEKQSEKPSEDDTNIDN